MNLAFLQALLVKDLEVVKFLLITKQIDINDSCFFEETILYSAMRTSSEAVLNFLFKYNFELEALRLDVNKKSQGESAILYAVKQDKIDLAKTLIERGSDVNQVDLGERSPLFIAVTLGNKDMVRLLLDSGAKIDYVNSKDEHVFLLAKDNKEVREVLNEYVKTKFYGTNNILHLACEYRNLELAKYLLNFSEIDVKANCLIPYDNISAIEIAFLQGDFKMAKLLLNKGALDFEDKSELLEKLDELQFILIKDPRNSYKTFEILKKFCDLLAEKFGSEIISDDLVKKLIILAPYEYLSSNLAADRVVDFKLGAAKGFIAAAKTDIVAAEAKEEPETFKALEVVGLSAEDDLLEYSKGKSLNLFSILAKDEDVSDIRPGEVSQQLRLINDLERNAFCEQEVIINSAVEFLKDKTLLAVINSDANKNFLVARILQYLQEDKYDKFDKFILLLPNSAEAVAEGIATQENSHFMCLIIEKAKEGQLPVVTYFDPSVIDSDLGKKPLHKITNNVNHALSELGLVCKSSHAIVQSVEDQGEAAVKRHVVTNSHCAPFCFFMIALIEQDLGYFQDNDSGGRDFYLRHGEGSEAIKFPDLDAEKSDILGRAVRELMVGAIRDKVFDIRRFHDLADSIETWSYIANSTEVALPLVEPDVLAEHKIPLMSAQPLSKLADAFESPMPSKESSLQDKIKYCLSLESLEEMLVAIAVTFPFLNELRDSVDLYLHGSCVYQKPKDIDLIIKFTNPKDFFDLSLEAAEKRLLIKDFLVKKYFGCEALSNCNAELNICYDAEDKTSITAFTLTFLDDKGGGLLDIIFASDRYFELAVKNNDDWFFGLDAVRICIDGLIALYAETIEFFLQPDQKPEFIEREVAKNMLEKIIDCEELLQSFEYKESFLQYCKAKSIDVNKAKFEDLLLIFNEDRLDQLWLRFIAKKPDFIESNPEIFAKVFASFQAESGSKNLEMMINQVEGFIVRHRISKEDGDKLKENFYCLVLCQKAHLLTKIDDFKTYKLFDKSIDDAVEKGFINREIFEETKNKPQVKDLIVKIFSPITSIASPQAFAPSNLGRH